MLGYLRESNAIRPMALDRMLNVSNTGVKFKYPDSKPLDFTGHVPKFLRTPAKWFLNNALTPLPKVDRSRCVGCGKCAESCPPQIIRIKDRKALFTSKGCISCFCCQEMCPVHAISIKRRINI